MTRDPGARMGRTLFLLGAAALTAAALLAGANLLEQHRAGENADRLLERVEAWTAQPTQESGGAVLVQAPEGGSSPWDNYDVDGVLEVPDLGLKLPVLSQYTEDLLKISPCIYQGPEDGQSRRLVIAGHNYRTHFGRLDRLAPGAELSYTTLDGTAARYRVTALEEVGPEDGALLEEGEWDLTLLTCNLDMSRRLLVRCARLEPEPAPEPIG